MTGFAKPTLAVFNGKPGCYCIIQFLNHTMGGVSSNR